MAGTQGRSQDYEFGGGLEPMASSEREPIYGDLGAEPPAGSRGRALPPEAERVLVVGRPVEAVNFPHFMHF